jgi:translation initiation factor 3 subunit B
MDGFQFDAKHRFALDRFSEVESFTRLDESFTAPTTEPYKQKVSSYILTLNRLIFFEEHLRAWLADEYGRDQYLIFQNDDVEIHWHGKPSQSDLDYKKAVSCTTAVVGSYSFSADLD